ncbi:MAG: hypothetical protein ACRDHY_03670, partial [Anaerolineales bacterium]
LAAASIPLPGALRLLGVECIAYVSLVAGAALWEAIRRRDFALLPGVMAALFTMHLCWGTAFWAGLLRGWPRGKPNR